MRRFSRANLSRIGRSILTSYRAANTGAALPTTARIDVSDVSFEGFVHLYDPIRPVDLTLAGPGEPLRNMDLAHMVAHATRAGSQVNVVTNGTMLDAGRAYALLEAGLAGLTVSIEAVQLEAVLRNIEKLVAMRDANRKPGPAIELQLVWSSDNSDQLTKLIELCHSRLRGIEPIIVLIDARPIGDVAALAALRQACDRARAFGFRRTTRSIESAIAQLTEDRASRLPGLAR